MGTLRLSWVQCLTDVLQWLHILQQKRVFILPLLDALWRMADQLIMETCSSGILSRTDVCHKHLVLVIQLRTLRRLWIGCISSGLFFQFFFWACGLDWQAITRTTHNKTTRSFTVGLWNNDPVGSNLFSKRNKNAHIALMMSPVCQIPCMRLSRHWLSMKMFHSGSAAIGEGANAVTPELGTKSLSAALRLFDIVTRLLLCVQLNSERSHKDLQL